MRNKFFFILILVLSFGLSDVWAQTPKPKSISAGVVNGKATSLPKPEYPAAARAVKASGAVNVQVVIDEEGNIISASAVSGHPLLRQASEQAARLAKFSSTRLSGQPVKVTGVIVYNFVPPENTANNEEKLMMMGLGAFLSVSNLIPNDEWEILNKKELAEVPQIADELAPLTLVTKETSKEKRAQIVNKVIASLENKLTGSDAWQFKFGKEFGALMIEFGKGNENTDHSIDEVAVKTRLLIIRDLMFTVPADFPQDVLENFKKIVKFADVPNLNSDENKSRFSQLLGETLNNISPD